MKPLDEVAQEEKILAYLKTGKTLTNLEALYKFGAERCSARIHRLKDQGAPIDKEMIKTGSGKRVAKYFINFN